MVTLVNIFSINSDYITYINLVTGGNITPSVSQNLKIEKYYLCHDFLNDLFSILLPKR